MKTATMPAAATKETDMMRDVQRAIDTAPSRALLRDAREKLTALCVQRESTVEEIDRLAKDLAAGKDNPSERAKDLLTSGKVSDETIIDALRAARRRLAVIDEAITMQQRAIQNLSAEFAREVNKALTEARRPLVAKMAVALMELREAADIDAQIGGLLAKAGVNAAFVSNISFPPVSGDCAYDAGWLQARKAEGYTV